RRLLSWRRRGRGVCPVGGAALRPRGRRGNTFRRSGGGGRGCGRRGRGLTAAGRRGQEDRHEPPTLSRPPCPRTGAHVRHTGSPEAARGAGATYNGPAPPLQWNAPWRHKTRNRKPERRSMQAGTEGEVTKLLAAVQAGRPGALERLIELLYPRFHRMARHLL